MYFFMYIYIYIYSISPTYRALSTSAPQSPPLLARPSAPRPYRLLECEYNEGKDITNVAITYLLVLFPTNEIC